MSNENFRISAPANNSCHCDGSFETIITIPTGSTATPIRLLPTPVVPGSVMTLQSLKVLGTQAFNATSLQFAWLEYSLTTNLYTITKTDIDAAILAADITTTGIVITPALTPCVPPGAGNGYYLGIFGAGNQTGTVTISVKGTIVSP